MKIFARLAVLAALLAPGCAFAQFSNSHPDGVPMPPVSERGAGPVAVGQMQAQRDDSGKVTIVQAPPVEQKGGGLIQLSAFGWLEPYADTLVQLLISAGLAWFAKSRYSAYLDETSRAALETFLKNRASSLIADGFVSMDGKTVSVHSAALANEVSIANDRIPDAMKRFGLTPAVIAQKIVDAIPQVAAGAAIVATAHEAPVIKVGDIMVKGDLPADKEPLLPPTSGAEA